MPCHVLRLDSPAECGACSRSVEPGRVVISDEIEAPVFVVVCRECAPGLDGAETALRLVESVGAARSGRRTPGLP